jgi:Cys-rich protein (TIGR01571 family)
VFVLTTPPRRVPVVFLSDPWTTPLFTNCAAAWGGWALSHLCCYRCHLLGQHEALRSAPQLEERDELERNAEWETLQNYHYDAPCWLRPLVCAADLLTAGTPCGVGWSGCGSLLLGCHVRTEIRKKYHILGNGLDDIGIVCMCPMFATRQHQMELLHRNSIYTVPCIGGSSDRMEMI